MKIQVTTQANGASAIYTDTGKESMADEILLATIYETNFENRLIDAIRMMLKLS